MTATTDAPASLAALLREGSAQEHRDAEESTFVRDLLAGEVDAAGYLRFLSRLAVVYDAMESTAAELADDPIAAAVIDPALERRATIDQDLAYWSERAGVEYPGIDAVIAQAAADSPVAAGYAQRVRESARWGGLFVSHHYTRYLGDLSGGQVIGQKLTRDLPKGQGVAFFEFPEIPKPKPYKDDYRARLDALEVTEDQRAEMLAEVKAAFAFNEALFREMS
ncbi:MAG: biliverdin-producing heme oxygenase [Nocardioidaceae bacterium]|nr:MAG: biliverdin-producing heme oxygenase [Nocardioidaceae bacterium]